VQSSLADARRTLRLSIKLLVLLALPLAAVVTLLADFMIGTLGGAEFLPHGAIALRLVMWSIPIGWINSVTNYAIVSLGLERRLTIGFVVGVLFNMVGNILLIPRFGYVAAALTTVASEMVLLLLFNVYLRQRLEPIGWVNLLWRPVAAAGLMAGGMWLGMQIHVALGVVAGLALYGVGLWLLRVFGAEERGVLAQVLPRPLAARLGLA
jgi:O-antigen/teichoic acid export membrane protein